MSHPSAEEYYARAADCNLRAENTIDANSKAEWLKLARSWQAMAEEKAKKSF
jgi:hypothetical protein